LNLVDEDEIALLNSGDLSVAPTVTITTRHTRAITLSVGNDTTGERIVPFSTIRSGQTIVIDNERKALYKNGVEIEYAGGFFTLAAGSNTLVFSLSAESISGETPSINVEIEWRAKYL
jgi:phage-related protein